MPKAATGDAHEDLQTRAARLRGVATLSRDPLDDAHATAAEAELAAAGSVPDLRSPVESVSRADLIADVVGDGFDENDDDSRARFADFLRLIGAAPDEILAVQVGKLGVAWHHRDGSWYLAIPKSSAPDGAGKRGVMFLAPPTPDYAGSFPVYSSGPATTGGPSSSAAPPVDIG
jgi:hypothetical protein